MRELQQRVSHASVKVDGEIIGQIGRGFLALFGAGQGDTGEEIELLASKTAFLRVFEDENSKMNRSVLDIDGGVLVVPNFTLYADSRKGRRPSFTGAAVPAQAEGFYVRYCEALRQHGVRTVERGRFGADMKVELLNDGPVTLLLDSAELAPKEATK